MNTFFKQNRRKKMKKVLLAFTLVLTAVMFFGTRAYASGTGNLVVHFQAWDQDYETLGSWAWGDTAAGRIKDGVDSFGAYFNFDNIAVGTEVGFIAVDWVNGGPDWNAVASRGKLTGDVNLGADVIKEGKTVHVYVFEGAAGPEYLVADPDKFNALVVYYDPTGNYEENLGLHHWGWTLAGPSWASPDKILTTVGVSAAGYDVKGVLLTAVETWAGFLIYAGGDDTKKTGDVKPDTGFFTTHTNGAVDVLYVINAGDGNNSNENIYLTPQAFADEAFSFKLMPFNGEEMSGTYAVDPQTIIVKTSAPIASPYPSAVDKEEARETIENWFTVREVISEGVYGNPLLLERVDFATSNQTLNSFVVLLDDANPLDNTKDYEIFFNLNHPENLEVAKEVTVTVNVTVPANTPTDAVLSIAGGLNGWTPGSEDYIATKVGETLVYTLSFTIDVMSPYTTIEYKWTRGSWPTEEYVASNRPMVIPNFVDTVTFDDVILSWADIDAPAEKYPAPVRVAPEVPMNLKASLPVAMDDEAPVLAFISPAGIVGKVPAQRIIEVAWGQPFNQNLFPRYRVEDTRDGELTPFVYVPKGQFSVLDTRTVGDYTIMLRVVDRWGNVTEETFIFRVVKP
jgi:hypothetical protein